MNDLDTLQSLSRESLEDEIATLSATLAAATYRLLLLVGELDRRGVPDDCRSSAHWLSWREGLSLGVARQYVRVAKALPELPKISEAFGKGELSFSKVRAITRVATPALEDDLLAWARAGTASHVETLVRRFRQANREEENGRALKQRDRRGLRTYWSNDGTLVIEARLTPEQGGVFLKALDRARDTLREAEHGSAEPSAESGDQVMADALTLVADQSLANGSAESSGADRFQVVVHVDQEVLADPDADGRCEVENGPAVSAETARRLACDASICEMTHSPDGTIMPGRKTRVISAPLRRALQARSGTRCQYPSCGAVGRHGHHVRHWANGGETVAQNICLLCHRHHVDVHEGGVTMEALSNGGFRFFRPDGQELVAAPPLPRVDLTRGWRELVQWVPPKVEITADTGRPTWMGERPDYDWMGWCLQSGVGE
jgi:hypothetical protein